jgi:hypothetical protein
MSMRKGKHKRIQVMAQLHVCLSFLLLIFHEPISQNEKYILEKECISDQHSAEGISVGWLLLHPSNSLDEQLINRSIHLILYIESAIVLTDESDLLMAGHRNQQINLSTASTIMDNASVFSCEV